MTNEQRYDNAVENAHLHEMWERGWHYNCACDACNVVPISAHPKFAARQVSRPNGPSYQGSE